MRKKIDLSNLPKHIAIIMDGNGRWAKRRLLSREAGHRAGAQAIKKLALEADKLGIKYLTVFAFSTENWNRSEDEVKSLMNLMRAYIQEYIDDTEKNNLKMRVIGDITKLDADLRSKIKRLMEMTASKTGLCVNIALNYGGRDDIVRAVKKITRDCMNGDLHQSDITEQLFSNYLDTSDIPEPDLLIRTSGEMRLSNFLLYQAAYTELYCTDILWPDFDISHLIKAISDFQGRNRRFGGRPSVKG